MNNKILSKIELKELDYAAMREQDGRGRLELAVKKAEERGERKNNLKTAKSLKAQGVSIEIIIITTGLSKAEIEEL